jgi:hypothetical protein
MFPYLDLAGFRRLTMMPSSDVTYVENDSPGFTAARIAVRSSEINGRLRKRYGNGRAGNSLPFGQNAPTLLAAGTAPPFASLQGRPTVGSVVIALQITTGGAFGVALFEYSIDGGLTFVAKNVATAASVPLVGTGMSVAFSTLGTFSTDNVYSAATPVPSVVLGWLVDLVTYDMYWRRGLDPAGETWTKLKEDFERTQAALKEAADSKEGLYDLPSSEDQDSAVTTGGPLGCSDASPYAWQDRQVCRGRRQDRRDFDGGTGGFWWPS